MLDAAGRRHFVGPHYMTSTIGDGQRLLAFSGIVVIDFKGETHTAWRADTVTLSIDTRAVIPEDKALRLIHYVPFVTINAIYNQAVSHDSGHAVDRFELVNPGMIYNAVDIRAHLAVRDSDAWLFRIGYHLLLTGELVDRPPPSDLI